MPISEGRFNKLEERVTNIGDRIAKVEGATGSLDGQRGRGKWATWIPVGAPVVALIAVLLTGAIHLDNKIGSLGHDIEALTTRVGKTEAALKVLGDNQHNPTKQIIHDLLAAAKGAKPEVAARAMEVAANLVAVLRNENQPAEPNFFKDTFDEIQSVRAPRKEPQIKSASFKVERGLAEYRSTRDWIDRKPKEQDTRKFAEELARKIGGTVYECSPNFRDDTMFNAAKGSEAADHIISGGVIINCPQVLDGFTFKGTVFINANVKYHGGTAILDHVAFLNCTFETTPSEEGRNLLKYAALSEQELKLKQSPSESGGI